MAIISTMNFTGTSGKEYSFNVYELDTRFKKDLGAVYMVTHRREKPDGKYAHARIFIGETGDLSSGFVNHTKRKEFESYDANCVCVHRENDKATRQEVEQDLASRYSTRL